jgi:predicted nucleic acid-binding protein
MNRGQRSQRRPAGAVERPSRSANLVFLLDTNVVSEFRRVRPHAAVLAWLRRVSDSDLHVSAVTIGEIQAGIEITREQDSVKALEIEAWLDLVAETYNVLPMDARSFRFWARLMHRRPRALHENAMIAATAEAHNLIVVTRNVRDFEQLGVRTLNPFSPVAR